MELNINHMEYPKQKITNKKNKGGDEKNSKKQYYLTSRHGLKQHCQ